MCAVSGKSTLSTIEGILIEAKMPDTCVFTTFDLEKGVRITVEAKVVEEGKFIINAQKFIQTLRVMNEDEVTLTVDNKLSATIFCGKSSHRMSALMGEDFPSIPELSSDRSFIVGQSVLKKMLGKVSFAMGVNDQRTVLNGTFFKITDDSVMMVSCDSFKLAKCKKNVELVNRNTNGNAHLEYSFIVPIKTVNELIKLLDGMLCHVNLIPINEIRERDFRKSRYVERFQKRLTDAGINATVRRTLGADISAACGQLRRDDGNSHKAVTE